MSKNYHEVRVDGRLIKYEKMDVNGHPFEIFIEYLTGASEWYAGIVGVLPEYLERDHKKPGLIGRGASVDECRDAAREKLGELFPAWSDEKMKEYRAEKEAAAKAAEAAEAAKKADAKAAKKAAK